MAFTFGAGATGQFEDTTNSDTIAATDNYCWSLALGSANAVTFGPGAVTETAAAPAALTPLFLNAFDNPMRSLRVVGY